MKREANAAATFVLSNNHSKIIIYEEMVAVSGKRSFKVQLHGRNPLIRSPTRRTKSDRINGVVAVFFKGVL